MRRHGFTLIELLVVVAIIAILAAIAVPNLLEAQTRSKVSAAKANLRTGVIALEAYAVDMNCYPPTRALFPQDPLGLLAQVQLRGLSTPVAYLSSSESLKDPFGAVRVRGVAAPSPSTVPDLGTPFPEITPPNTTSSVLYFHYPTLTQRLSVRSLGFPGSALVSIGPDRSDSAGAYVVADPAEFSGLFGDLGFGHPVDTIYDPTNGTVSEGDIPRFTSAVRAPSLP